MNPRGKLQPAIVSEAGFDPARTMNSFADSALPATAETSVCPFCAGLRNKILAEYEGRALRQCFDCGGSYASPPPSSSELAAHFQEEATDDRGLKDKFETNREKVLARVAAYVQRRQPRGKILDIGCATGIFLAHFFRRPNWDAWGLELSPLAAEKAAAQGVRVYRGDIHRARFAEHSFDVITVLDAFYYFPEPERELAEFHRVLTHDGLLVLELPWAGSRIWRTSTPLGRMVSGTRRPLLQSSDHLFYFTPKSVVLLLTRCGFHVHAILPLPGNQQAGRLRDLAFRVYSAGSALLHSVSGGRIFLGPRFLVAAAKNPPSATAGE
jgi:SAM-dependent methyltransferase